MTRIFSRMNAAFHAYEASLLRPIARPAPRDVPSLWQRAKSMFSATVEKVRALVGAACRYHLARFGRSSVLARLVPVEKLTRALLTTEAATFLLMTPAGIKLRREARIREMPTCTPATKPMHHAWPSGWTEVRIPPPASPKVVAPRVAPDPEDPKTWRCPFEVMRWVFPEDDDDAPSKKDGPRPRLLAFDTLVVRKPESRQQTPVERRLAGCNIARRIEALSRVLENPEPAIHRLARFLATLPREALADMSRAWVDTHAWYDGRNDYTVACEFSDRATGALLRSRPTESEGINPEPG